MTTVTKTQLNTWVTQLRAWALNFKNEVDALKATADGMGAEDTVEVDSNPNGQPPPPPGGN